MLVQRCKQHLFQKPVQLGTGKKKIQSGYIFPFKKVKNKDMLQHKWILKTLFKRSHITLIENVLCHISYIDVFSIELLRLKQKLDLKFS